MSNIVISIDLTLLQHLVARGLIELVQDGADILAKAGEKIGLSVTDDAKAFDEFYARYPRKVGKRAARRAWVQAVKRATPSEIHHGLNPETIKREAGGMTFIPHPATWLNRDGWLDEYVEEKTIHDELREALLNDITIRDPDALASEQAERLPVPVRGAKPPDVPRLAAPEDQADRRGDQLGDPFWSL